MRSFTVAAEDSLTVNLVCEADAATDFTNPQLMLQFVPDPPPTTTTTVRGQSSRARSASSSRPSCAGQRASIPTPAGPAGNLEQQRL